MFFQGHITKLIQNILILTVLMMLFIPLVACGKKPNFLDKPDIEQSTYPQKYPVADAIPGTGPQFNQ